MTGYLSTLSHPYESQHIVMADDQVTLSNVNYFHVSHSHRTTCRTQDSELMLMPCRLRDANEGGDIDDIDTSPADFVCPAMPFTFFNSTH